MKITLVYAYYRSPEMFKRQLREWSNYPAHIRDQVEFIVTDDCSPKGRITETLPHIPDGINIRIFRVLQKKKWNWLTCRNIGAHYAAGEWLLLTDMDHMMAAKNIIRLWGALPELEEDIIYLFTRVDAPFGTPYKPHDDSYFMTKSMYWEIGGYDEEFSGLYGTSGLYRQRAFATAGGHRRLKIPLTRFPREVMPDASTTEFTRKLPDLGHKKFVDQVVQRKVDGGRIDQIQVLSFPYEEIKIK